MASGKPSFCNLIQFVLQRSEIKNKEEKWTKLAHSSQLNEDGDDIKNFYETLVNNGTASNKNVCPSDLVYQKMKSKSNNQSSAVTAKTDFVFKDVHDDYDRKAEFNESEKSVGFRTSKVKSQTSNTEFNESEKAVDFRTSKVKSQASNTEFNKSEKAVDFRTSKVKSQTSNTEFNESEKAVDFRTSEGKSQTSNTEFNESEKTVDFRTSKVKSQASNTEFNESEKTVDFRTSEVKSHASNTNFNKLSTQVPFHIPSQHLKLLHAAQMGELKQVAQQLEKGADINYQDFFGWTPLMCAAKEGHDNVVRYLLKHGSDYTICSLEGQTAYMLAKIGGHKHIVKTMAGFFNKQYNDTNITPDGVEQEPNISSAYYCQICKSEFSMSEKISHETSTVHLFNSGHKRKGPSYVIPETNKGFQMLLKTGWEVDKGLGPNGEGPKYPVKTILKYDRKGLGNDDQVKKKAKITHFNPNDKSAVVDHKLPQRKLTARKAARYATNRREKKERQFEQRLRFELSGGLE